jgi:hypothetical protein
MISLINYITIYIVRNIKLFDRPFFYAPLQLCSPIYSLINYFFCSRVVLLFGAMPWLAILHLRDPLMLVRVYFKQRYFLTQLNISRQEPSPPELVN